VEATHRAPTGAMGWPRFAPAAVDAGYRGLMSTTLSTDGGLRAALNLYSVAPNTFSDHCRTMAGLFGIQAALLLYGTSQTENLQKAVDSRDVIGRAKGILMERFNVDDEARPDVGEIFAGNQPEAHQGRSVAHHRPRPCGPN
jgi:hypothetical protein